MNRRNFLSGLIGSIAAAVAVPSLVEAAVESLAKPASVAVAPVGCGIPNCYPLCMSTPLDRAYLMPFNACLFDSEYGCDDNLENLETQLFFNTKPYRANESGLKQETNIWQSMMLDYPREFKAHSLGIFVNGAEVNRNARVSLLAHYGTSEELNDWPGNKYPHNVGLNTVMSRKLKYFPRDTTGRIMERVSNYSYSQATRCVENNGSTQISVCRSSALFCSSRETHSKSR